MVGRTQNILEINIFTNIYTGDNTDLPTPVPGAEVYVSMNPKHRRSHEEDKPSVHNLLMDPIRHSEAFSSVLKAWLDRDEKWRTARVRLSSGWGERDYGYDRIIRVANVFDLLPKGEFGDDEPLSQKMQAAVKKTRETFRCLPESSDRDMVLNTLGRVGSWTLKKKIHRRAESITEAIGSEIPEFQTVIDRAVDCRNLYVHGNHSGDSSGSCDSCLPFLTDTLEFVFFASDLVDAGWDIESWYNKKPRLRGHPFLNYLTGYERNLAGLLKN